MKKLSLRETIILAITLVLMIFFVFFQGVIKPIQEGAMSIDDQLRLDRHKLVKADQLVAQGPDVEARYNRLVHLIGLSGPEETEMPLIESRIDAAARQSNIHIANMQPLKSVAFKEARFFPVELEIDGQWLDIVAFLDQLQQAPDFYFVNELSLEKYSDTSDALRGRIVIGLMGLTNP